MKRIIVFLTLAAAVLALSANVAAVVFAQTKGGSSATGGAGAAGSSNSALTNQPGASGAGQVGSGNVPPLPSNALQNQPNTSNLGVPQTGADASALPGSAPGTPPANQLPGANINVDPSRGRVDVDVNRNLPGNLQADRQRRLNEIERNRQQRQSTRENLREDRQESREDLRGDRMDNRQERVNDPDRWRFAFHNGEWWYWTPGNYWMYHRDNNWQRFESDAFEPSRLRYRTAYRGTMDDRGRFYTDENGRRYRRDYSPDRRILRDPDAGARIGGAIGGAVGGDRGAQFGTEIGGAVDRGPR